jgi:hypothetical protein
LSYIGISNAIGLTREGPYFALRDDGTLVPFQGTNTPPWSNIVATAAYSGAQLQLLGLRSDGTVVSWNGPFPVPPSLSNVVVVARNSGSRLALKRDGAVVAWGSGGETNVPPGLSNIVAISAFASQGLALKP